MVMLLIVSGIILATGCVHRQDIPAVALEPEVWECELPQRPKIHVLAEKDRVCFLNEDARELARYLREMDRRLKECRIHYEGLKRKYNIVIKGLQ